MVLIIIGENASGKTTLANYLEMEFGFLIVDIGDFVRKNYKMFHYDNELLSDYAQRIFDSGYIVSIVKEAILYSKKSHSKHICFCGARTLSGIKQIINDYSDAKIINIYSSYSNRKNRYYKGEGDSINFEKRNSQESSWIEQIYRSIKIDYIIENNSDINHFLQSAKDVILSIKCKEKSPTVKCQ